MKNLKKLRTEKGLSQKAFAEIMHASQNTVSQWENGTREPNQEITTQIADYFNVTIDYLVGRESTPSLDEQLQGVDFALYGEVHDLTDEEKQDILNFIKFKKSQRGD